MTLTQTLEYNDEDGVVAMSNILSQVLTEDELDSYGLTFEEYVAENETSFAEMEEIAGATFTISSDADTLTITIGLRIDFETYDFETDVYALGSTDNYADVDTIESTLVAYGYTCETIE